MDFKTMMAEFQREFDSKGMQGQSPDILLVEAMVRAIALLEDCRDFNKSELYKEVTQTGDVAVLGALGALHEAHMIDYGPLTSSAWLLGYRTKERQLKREQSHD